MKNFLFIVPIIMFINMNAISQEWHRTKTIFDPMGIELQTFGVAISISGQIAVVSDVVSARVYVYKLEYGDWVQKSFTQYSQASVEFGVDVCISGNKVFVGAPNYDKNTIVDCGAVIIYNLNPSSGTLTYNSTIVHNDADSYDFFGTSISAENNIVLVGASKKENSLGIKTGAAYVFEQGTNGLFEQKCKILPSNGAFGDTFGGRLSMEGNKIVISSVGYDYNSLINPGAVYLYSYDIGTHLATEQQFFTSPNPNNSECYGQDLMIHNNNIIIGATDMYGIGNVYCYKLVTNYELYQKLAGEGSGMFGNTFGSALCFDSETLIIGARSEGIEGSVYYYKFDGLSWNFVQKEKNSCYTSQLNGGFGSSIALSGDYSIIGNPRAGTSFIQPPSDQVHIPSAIYFYKRTPPLVIYAGEDRTILPGESVTLGGEPTASGGWPPYTYTWTSTPVSSIQPTSNPVVSPTTTTTYHLVVKDQYAGCLFKQDDVTITIESECQFPIEYSPNFYESNISTNASGNLTLIGTFYGNSVQVGNKTLTGSYLSPTNNNTLISSHNHYGSLKWSHMFATSEFWDPNPQPCSHKVILDNNECTYALIGIGRSFLESDVLPDGLFLAHNNLFGWIGKFSNTGALLWNKTIECSYNNGDVYLFDIFLDSDCLYAAGYCHIPFIYLGKFVNSGTFVMKFTTDGSLLWVCNTSQTEYNSMQRMSKDSNGNILIFYTGINNYNLHILEINSISGTLKNDFLLTVPTNHYNSIGKVIFDGQNKYFIDLFYDEGMGYGPYIDYYLHGLSEIFRIDKSGNNYTIANNGNSLNYHNGMLWHSGSALSFSGGKIFNKSLQMSAPGVLTSDIAFNSIKHGKIDYLTLFEKYENDLGYAYIFQKSEGMSYLNIYNTNEGFTGCVNMKQMEASTIPDKNPQSNINKSVVFYPNPTRDKLDIQFPFTETKSEINIKVYSSTGTLVISKSHEPSSEFNVDLAALQPGIYYIIINRGENIYSTKVVKN